MDRAFMSRGEEIADEIIRKSRHVLPHVARFCLVSTFFEDGLRMWFQWKDQQDYMDSLWHCGTALAFLFVLLNLVTQLGCVSLVLLRRYVNQAVCALFATVVVQTFAYNVFTDVHFLLRNFALVGGLLLLLAETRAEGRSIFAGVPSLGENKHRTYLMLAGRVLLAFMLITIIRFEFNIIYVIEILVGIVFMILIVVGYKTKFCSLALVAWLMILNVYFNAWWNASLDSLYRDFLKYDFFQTLSVIGGLLMLVSIGPGGVSMDEHKKAW